ncbi:MAG: hypothetical protein ACXWCH_32390, partial [Burkholderiales bacterium]
MPKFPCQYGGPQDLKDITMDQSEKNPKLAHNVKRLSRLELPGAGQVYVDGKYAYVGHIPNKQQLGTSILDIS